MSVMLLLLGPAQGQAATFTVNSTTDAVDANIGDGICQTAGGVCTLRAAIQEANALAGPDTINLPAGTYTLTIAGAGEVAAATGDLNVNALGGAVTIVGAGSATTIIDGGALDRIFDTIGAATLDISGVTLRNGNPGVAASGGAINTSGGTIVNLFDVVITGNTSGVEGGAINIAANVASAVTMTNVVIANNNSGAGGDIIANGAGAKLTITNGTINGNSETAISNKAGSTVTLTNVTISGNNTAAAGVGISAIDNLGIVNLQNVTVASNIAAVGAGNGGLRNQAGATFNLRNTIISANTPANCIATAAFNSQGNNIEDTNTCGLIAAGDVPSAGDVKIAALANNTGPVQTHALLLGSPAIDGGTATGCPGTDARGILRPQQGKFPGAATCDVGAFEFRPQKIVVTPASPFDFGAVTIGTTAAPHAITLTNAGDGDLILSPVTGPLAPFSILASTTTCTTGSTLTLIPLPVPAANSSCVITTDFAPTAAVASVGTVTIPSNDPVTAAVAYTLNGAGTVALVPAITVTDSIAPDNDHSLPFGSVSIGQTSDATVTVTNTGTAALIIGTITPPSAPFSITSDGCSGQSVAASAACTLGVRFAPTANSAINGTFVIPNNVASSPTVTINLGGSGVSATGNHPPTSPVLVSPTNGQTGVTTTFTFVWNKSTDPDADAVTYHFFNCTDTNFTAGCTNSDVAAAPSGILYAGLASFGMGFVMIGFIKRSRMTMLAITLLLVSGAFFMSCHKSSSDETPPPPAEQISKTVANLAPGTTYYWKVVADDGKGGQTSSEVRSYTTAP